MKTSPTEMLYWEILPAIRKELVSQLFEELKLKQVDIANLLDVTPSAISQYLNNKRGSNFHFTQFFKNEIFQSAKKIAFENADSFAETTRLIKFFESSRALCELCHHKNGMLSSCNLCFEKES